MSSLLRQSTSLARAAAFSLRSPARLVPRIPRGLRSSPSIRSPAVLPSRYYSSDENGKPRRENDPAKDTSEDRLPKDKSKDNESDPGQVKGNVSPAADDRPPLPDGWVHLTEDEFNELMQLGWLWSGKSSFFGDTMKESEIRMIRRTGVPKAFKELMSTNRAGGFRMSHVGKAWKATNLLAARLVEEQMKQAQMEDKPRKESDASSQPAANREESLSSKDSPREENRPKDDEAKSGSKPNSSKSSTDFKQNTQGGSGKRKPGGPPPGPWQNDNAINLILASIFFYYVYQSMSDEGGRDITWQELRAKFLDKGLVKKMVVVGDRVRVELDREATQSMYPDSAAARPGFHYYFSIGSVDTFERHLDEAQKDLGIPPSDRIPVSYTSPSGITNFFLAFGPTLLIVGLIYWAQRRGPGGGGGGGIFGVGKSVAKRFSHESAVKIKFADVAGMDEAKQEIMEFVSFLKKPEKFQRLGAKIPRGAILAGPPGTGKTMLAKATAGESGVPFYSVSGSEFVEMFVGVGASRVRDLFSTARKNAPCIIFIDEIDAIGRSRSEGKNIGGGHDEREATLNQILTEMDGFNTTEQVVVLAGTNRVDILDKALMRPGRFDRHVNIDKPTMAGRKDIFKVYLKKILTKEDFEHLSGRLAALTPGFAGADIANCVNEAALIAARSNAASVLLEHFEQAIERVIGGLERKSLVLSPKEKRTVAYHEAGHAICGWFFEFADPLLKVSIIPRSQALGYAQYLPGDAYLMTYQQLMDRMAMTLGGRISEELHFPTVTTGASDDFRKVTGMATRMVTEWGMSDKVGPIYFHQSNESFQKPFAEITGKTIDEEIKRIVEQAYKQCRDLLEVKRKEIGLVAEELLSKEMLVRDDMIRLLGPRPFDDRAEFEKYFGKGRDTPPDDPPPTPPAPGAIDTPPGGIGDGGVPPPTGPPAPATAFGELKDGSGKTTIPR